MTSDWLKTMRRARWSAFFTMSLLLFPAALPLCAQQGAPRLPLEANQRDGAESRWLQKPVLASRLLDGMEDLSTWSFQGEGDMALSDAYVHQGQHSLRIRSKFNIARVAGPGEWEDLVATRKFPSEDWRPYNRISLWVYADVAGAPAIPASLMLHNEGAHILPDQYNEGRDESLLLKNHAWTHVVWEIAPLDRDKITAIDFAYSLPKMFPDPGDHTILYIDQLELQKVVPDHVEGWDVAAGKIAFSHAGYTTGSSKSAIASDLAAQEFSVVDQSTGKAVFTAPVKQKKTASAAIRCLISQKLEAPGTYTLRAGSETTRSFTIGDDAWRDSVLKAINFMYTERCGTVIPGVHGICHQDDYTSHGDQRIVINGGYHDAGDLTATGNTPGMTYALLSYIERLQQQGEDPELEARMIEEAKWGLAWVLKTSFHDGYRSTGQLISYWTDGIIGDADDRHGEAVNDPEWNFRVAAVEALAARVLKQNDPGARQPQPRNRRRRLEIRRRRPQDCRASARDLRRERRARAHLLRSHCLRRSLPRHRRSSIRRRSRRPRRRDHGLAAAHAAALDHSAHRLFLYQPEAREPLPSLPPRSGRGARRRARASLRSASRQSRTGSAGTPPSCCTRSTISRPPRTVDAPYDVLPAAVYRESEVRLLPKSKTGRRFAQPTR